MTFELYQEVALAQDLPAEGLRRSDVATVVERLPAIDGQEGYVLEVFNALGETMKVVVVPATAISSITADEILSVRSLAPRV
ncbi:MAG: DUF4926 domain-containing protein [Chloroflexota bacterium]|nr:DUF4926 domain-containing protein [Chloroflexota bacterium]